MTKTQKILTGVFVITLATAAMVVVKMDDIRQWLFRPTSSNVQQGISGQNKAVTVAKNLATPWEVLFLPNNDMLITERPGKLTRIGQDNRSYAIKGVQHTSEGGLLGAALHPDFPKNHWVYLYYTTTKTNKLTNVVERYTLEGDTLGNATTIIDEIPAAENHDGGRLAFGPDGYLYVTTGDAGEPTLSQQIESMAGKVLRLSDDGSVPADNPFTNPVYSYGHRNIQGITWDGKGQLWATEHGRSGAQSGYDELNLIKRGANYGWPVAEGDETREGMEKPIVHSGAKDTWAPAGMTYSKGSLFFAGLRGQALYQAKINSDNTITMTAHLREEYGRLRTAVEHNGSLYVATSNTDGRGMPGEDDDRILRFSRSIFGD